MFFPERPLLAASRPVLLLVEQFARERQRFLDPALAITSRPQSRRSLATARRTGIARGSFLKTAYRLRRFFSAIFQGRMPAERGRSRRCSHTNAVLRHAIQTRNACHYQARETVDEKVFQRRAVANTKISQGLGVHAHSAAQPPIGDMLAAKTRHLPRTHHGLDRREKPKSQQDARIRRRVAARPPLEGFDWAEQRGDRFKPSTKRQTAR